MVFIERSASPLNGESSGAVAFKSTVASPWQTAASPIPRVRHTTKATKSSRVRMSNALPRVVIQCKNKGAPVMKRGDKGTEVAQLQQALLQTGYKLPNYGADGHFGAETWDALAASAK